jgi:hypothetical protein
MSEREYRSQIAAVLAAIEQRARRLGRKVLLPAALGAGLALGVAGCSDDDNSKPDTFVPGADAAYGVPFWDMGVDGVLPGPDSAYGVPMPDAGVDQATDAVVPGPDAAYLGPDAN